MVWGCSWRPEALPHSLFLSAHFWRHRWPSWWPHSFVVSTKWTGTNVLKLCVSNQPLKMLTDSTLPSTLPSCIFRNQHVFWKCHVVACLSALENEQRTVCVTLGHKLHFVMTQTEELVVCVPVYVGGVVNPTLSTPTLSLYDSWRHSSELQGAESFSKHILEPIIPSLFIEKKTRRGGLWAGGMIMPLRGSERSVVECSCH